MSNINVTIPVTIASPVSPDNQNLLANASVLTVANAEAATLTRLFQINIVINNLSLSFFIY